MAGNPRIVTEDVTFFWDGVTQRLPKRQVIDVPPGSALEAAIGLDHLVPLGAVTPPPVEQAVPAQEAAPREEPRPAPKEAEAAPPKPAPVKAKAQDASDDKDGES